MRSRFDDEETIKEKRREEKEKAIKMKMEKSGRGSMMKRRGLKMGANKAI